MTERFKKAYDSLVRAYFEGTLAKGTCMACACGNIILDALGETLTEKHLDDYIGVIENSECYRLHSLSINKWASFRTITLTHFRAKYGFEKRVNEAGYTTEEFAHIENAFENACKINVTAYRREDQQKILEDQYNGLCAVVDVLMKLDEIKEGGEEFKQKFREHPKLQTV